MQNGKQICSTLLPCLVVYVILEMAFKTSFVTCNYVFQSNESSEILDGAIAQIVYKKALEAFPGKPTSSYL